MQDHRPPLKIYNTLSRQKEVFQPLHAPHVGMYVCGPTVYNEVHLGNVRTFTCFDIVYRYLSHLGYRVRYVRNITDVGHLQSEDDEDSEDKIAKRAKLENLEPMEIVQKYTNGFHAVMAQLNNLPPSIEPSATGHIVEQIRMTHQLLEKGLAYQVNGSVYFDVRKYHEQYPYGELSGRNIDELIEGTRTLDGQSEKRDALDFALWKKASPKHIMRWESPWGEGFPGWHLECSVMSAKYLGETFDIHGGGMDLKFPHHECEIAQGTGSHGAAPVRYWLHSNMLTVNGQKMSKSLGNGILPREMFEGTHPMLEKAYSPMTLRFFILQTHYRSTMDITKDALDAAQKGYKKLMNGLKAVRKLQYVADHTVEQKEKDQKQIEYIINSIYRGMNDDFNTAVALAGLFNLLKKINAIHTGSVPAARYTEATFDRMREVFITFTEEVLGLKEEQPQALDEAISIALESYREAKAAKAYDKVDEIRARFKQLGLVLMDRKNEVDWAYDEQ